MCNDVNTNLQLNKDPVFVLSTPASCSAFRQERHTWDPALLLGRSGIEELNFRWKQTVSMNSVGAILGLLSQNHSVRPELAQSPSLHLLHEIKHNLLLPAGKPIREPLLLRLQTAPWGKAQKKSHSQHRRCHGPWGYHAEQQPGHPSSERDRDVQLRPPHDWHSCANACLPLFIQTSLRVVTSPRRYLWHVHYPAPEHLEEKGSVLHYQPSELSCSANCILFSFIINNVAISLSPLSLSTWGAM